MPAMGSTGWGTAGMSLTAAMVASAAFTCKPQWLGAAVRPGAESSPRPTFSSIFLSFLKPRCFLAPPPLQGFLPSGH